MTETKPEGAKFVNNGTTIHDDGIHLRFSRRRMPTFPSLRERTANILQSARDTMQPRYVAVLLSAFFLGLLLATSLISLGAHLKTSCDCPKTVSPACSSHPQPELQLRDNSISRTLAELLPKDRFVWTKLAAMSDADYMELGRVIYGYTEATWTTLAPMHLAAVNSTRVVSLLQETTYLASGLSDASRTTFSRILKALWAAKDHMSLADLDMRLASLNRNAGHELLTTFPTLVATAHLIDYISVYPCRASAVFVRKFLQHVSCNGTAEAEGSQFLQGRVLEDLLYKQLVAFSNDDWSRSLKLWYGNKTTVEEDSVELKTALSAIKNMTQGLTVTARSFVNETILQLLASVDEITLDVSKLRKVVGRVMVVSAKRTENLSDDDVMQLRQAFLLTSAIANEGKPS